jgi:hypothetical protein
VAAAPPSGAAAPTSAVRDASPSPAALGRAASATDIDPCSLVTAEEAKAVLGGRTPQPPRRQAQLGDQVCFYELREGAEVVAVAIDGETGSGEVKETQEFVRRALGFESVHVVGESAFIDPGLNVIDVVTGATRFSIQIASSALSPAEVRATLVELGRAAVTRLR